MGKRKDPLVLLQKCLKAAPDICCKIIADLMNTIILEGKVPIDSTDSIIVSLFNEKGNASDQTNCYGLKLTDHVLKVIERVVETIIVGNL